MINSAKVPYEVISTRNIPRLKKKANSFNQINSYFYFIQAANHYLLSNNLQNSLFINDNCENFEEYKKNLLAKNYFELCKQACDCNGKCIEEFAIKFNEEINAILIFSEKEIDQQTAMEIRNLALITGKLGKTASGIIALKSKNNSQGLFDMGVRPNTGVGEQSMSDKGFVEKLQKKWNINNIPTPEKECFTERFFKSEFQNIFIFGENPVGCSHNNKKVTEAISSAEFVVVQDAFMSETAKMANLVLPSSLWFETGGSFTNTQRIIQEFDASIKPKVEKTSVEQLLDLQKQFGLKELNDVDDVKNEAISLLPNNLDESKLEFVPVNQPSELSLFGYGCDYLMEQFDKDFEE